MKKQSVIRPLARGIVVISLILLVISGVTFAALQSQQAVLAGNTITSASADLKISTDGINFGSSHSGFSFVDVIPGGAAVPAAGHSFYLKNSGSTTVNVKVSVGSVPTNLSSVDLSKVSVILTRVPGGTSQTFSLSSLISAYASGGVSLTDSLASNTTTQYKIQASMAADAFNGSGASLSNIDFVFMGTAL